MYTFAGTMSVITSRRNQRIVEARKLQQRKHRERQGRFLVEGLQLLQMALDGGVEPVDVFFCEEQCREAIMQVLLSRFQEAQADLVPVSPYVMPKGKLEERSIMAANREAIANAVDKSFGDCESALVEEIKFADDPSTAWLVLADWLEERGDARARWIRAHRLDLVAALTERVRRDLFEQQLFTSPIEGS